MNPKLELIAERAAKDLVSLIKEAEEKILEAWNAAEAEAQEQETKPKFKIGFGITLDLDADRMTTELSFGVRHKLSIDGGIPDPDQGELALQNTEVTIKTGSECVTVTGEQFSRAAKKITGKK